jgi:endonuclease G
VDDFLTTVEEIERLTKLDFGDAVRQADVRGGEADSRVASWSGIPLTPPPAANAAHAKRPPRKSAKR